MKITRLFSAQFIFVFARYPKRTKRLRPLKTELLRYNTTVFAFFQLLFKKVLNERKKYDIIQINVMLRFFRTLANTAAANLKKERDRFEFEKSAKL